MIQTLEFLQFPIIDYFASLEKCQLGMKVEEKAKVPLLKNIYDSKCQFLAILLLFFSSSVLGQNVRHEWTQNIKNSLNSINKSNSILTDGYGNSFVLGTTWMIDSAKDIILIKYDTAGKEVWRRIYDNPNHGDDIPMGMCLDREGNIWICGMARPTEDNADFLIVKFSIDGIPVSDEIYDGKDHLFDCANFIKPDKAGNVYAVGYETTLDSGINIVVTKSRPSGAFAWRRTYATRLMDVANELVVDDSCNIYVCGTINNGPHTADILVQKYDSTGKKKWELVYDGLMSQNDAGIFITADDSVNLYVSGFINHSNSRGDIPLIKISRNGQILHDVLYNGRVADCGAVSVKAGDRKVTLTGLCNDYNIAHLSTFLLQYDKSGKQKYRLEAPKDVQFILFDESVSPKVFGTKLTHPESTLMPYIAEFDTGGIAWEFADSTIYGLTHLTDILVDNNAVYFLGDDTGDASGTISVFKYILAPTVIPEEKPKKDPKKNK